MDVIKNVKDSYKKNPGKVILISLLVLLGLIFYWYVTVPLVIFIYLWKKFKKEEENKKDTKTKCPHCKTEINWDASRCPNCHGKITVWTADKKIGATILAFVILIGFINVGSYSSDPSSAPTTTTATNSAQIGEIAFLRLSNTSNPESIICLGSTKEGFDEVMTSLLANDFVGLLEIPGAFCVSNGTKVQVIDSGYGVRRVRIMEGVRKVDEDKVLRSGWTAMEWVSKN